jgi:carboxyl-terminal processing protease
MDICPASNRCKEPIFMARKKIQVWLPLLFALVMIAGMYIGYQLRDKTGNTGSMGSRSTSALPELMKLIREKYVDPVSADSIDQLVSNELLSHLDPHSVWLNRSALQEAEEEMNESFKGIGVEFQMIRDTVHVISLIPKAPAEEAGMQVGDQLLRVNDSIQLSSKKLAVAEVRKLLREQPEVKLKLTYLRNHQLRDISFNRGNVPLPSVDAAFMLTPRTGYLHLNKFANRSYEEFMQQMEGLQKKGMQQLVLDLRGNGGGLMKEAIDIADEFLSNDKLIVYTMGEHVPRNNYFAKREGIFEKGQLVVLIDESSASASEVLAGALQDWDRATIIGRRSFGKGLVQQQFSLSGGTAVRLTTARYYTPLGRNIQKPYQTDKETYQEEIMHRMLKSPNEKEDTTYRKGKVYTTPAGHKVYGGGGIQPDLVERWDSTELSSAIMELLYKNTLNIFTYQYYLQHKQALDTLSSPKQINTYFQPEDSFWNQLTAAATRDSISLSGITPPQKKFVLQRAKMLLARQLFRQPGYYEVGAQYDEAVRKALEILK